MSVGVYVRIMRVYVCVSVPLNGGVVGTITEALVGLNWLAECLVCQHQWRNIIIVSLHIFLYNNYTS